MDSPRAERQQWRGEEHRIASQHAKLAELLGRVEETLALSEPHRSLGDFLVFRNALDAHFTIEEETYFPALYERRADLGPELAELALEHERVRSALTPIQQALAADDRVRAESAIERLVLDIEAHESREEGLVARVVEGPLAASAGSPLSLYWPQGIGS